MKLPSVLVTSNVFSGLSSVVRPRAGAMGGLALAVLLGGCAPMQQNTLRDYASEAFPDLSGVADGQGVPNTATKVADYPVSYDDAFRAANMSVSQAQLNVEKVDARKGTILATREAQQVGGDGRPVETRYFYAISVTELGAKRSRIRIVAKMQAPCYAYSPAQRLMYDVGSLGATELINATLAPVFQDCKEHEQPNWPRATLQELGNFQVFVRNNLLAAGLL